MLLKLLQLSLQMRQEFHLLKEIHLFEVFDKKNEKMMKNDQ